MMIKTRLIAFLIAFLLPNPAAFASEIVGGAPRVIDADTLEVAGERVRFQGVDAPETKQHCWRDGKRYRCGSEATQALRQKIGAGAVTCTISGRDRYGRGLGVCRAADGTDLNGWLVRQGHALLPALLDTIRSPGKSGEGGPCWHLGRRVCGALEMAAWGTARLISKRTTKGEP